MHQILKQMKRKVKYCEAETQYQPHACMYNLKIHILFINVLSIFEKFSIESFCIKLKELLLILDF